MTLKASGQGTAPVEVRAPRGADTLEIDWADGHSAVYRHEVLRGFCPCAHCQGHQGPIRFLAAAPAQLEDIEEVGSYALRLSWSDGHRTGIYSFKLLRSLCCCPSCGSDDPTGRVFPR